MTDDFSTNFVKLEPAYCIKLCSPPTEEVIRLDKEGFHYRGQFIADAGKAHRLMVEFLRQNTKPELQGPTDEELLHVAQFAIEPYADCGIGVGEYEVETECAIETYGSELIAFARAVLERWGNQ